MKPRTEKATGERGQWSLGTHRKRQPPFLHSNHHPYVCLGMQYPIPTQRPDYPHLLLDRSRASPWSAMTGGGDVPCNGTLSLGRPSELMPKHPAVVRYDVLFPPCGPQEAEGRPGGCRCLRASGEIKDSDGCCCRLIRRLGAVVEDRDELEETTSVQGGGGGSSSGGHAEYSGGGGGRKKLRLSGDQLCLLERSFRQRSTLTAFMKNELAEMLGILPRQVEVWFQNKRARTKLKQTEVDCDILKKCCDNLKDENQRLKEELRELRSSVRRGCCFLWRTQEAAKTAASMCPSCDRLLTAGNINYTGASSDDIAAAGSVGNYNDRSRGSYDGSEIDLNA